MSGAGLQCEKRPNLFVSIAIFIVAVAFMGWLRLYLFRHEFVTLTYGLPLLVCLWHRDKVLLWAMVGTFALMSAYKSWFVLPAAGLPRENVLVQWGMQLLNLAIIGGVVHTILVLTARLTRRNAELAQANADLAARELEIRHQNEELAAQSEELQTQNEELQSQAEELTKQNEELHQQAQTMAQQAEELESQAEELEAQSDEQKRINTELDQRERMLQTILNSIRQVQNEKKMLENVCDALRTLMQPHAAAAAVICRSGDHAEVLTRSGKPFIEEKWPIENSLAQLVLQHGRTAFVDDLRARADLRIPKAVGAEFRSVLATPLTVGGALMGVVEVYSVEPRHWTSREFKVLEWVAAQCSLLLEIVRLQEETNRKSYDLEQANERLETLVEQRTAKLQELVDELEHFSYTITHDMRAPLRAMQGFAELLMEEAGSRLDPPHQHFLKQIMTAASRMDRLITDALSYSKAVKEEVELSRVNAQALLQGIIDSYPALQPPKAKIRVEGRIPDILGNEAALTQCFANLLTNAVKFVDPGKVPEVVVQAHRVDGVVKICFQDNGIGIPKEAHNRIFRMFQRLSKQYEGTGIGLALVRKVAERMGGRVGFDSEPGKGSRFWLDLKPAENGQGQRP